MIDLIGRQREIKAGVSTIVTGVMKLLGLCLENHVEDDVVRDTQGNKTSCTLYNYDSAANATTHDKATGLVSSYDVTAAYTAGKMTLFKSVKN